MAKRPCYNNGDYKELIRNAKKIVIKVGTSVLTHNNGELNMERIESLSLALSGLVHEGRNVILVSSGAVGAGIGKLGLLEKPASIAKKQALAAIGQGLLMQTYEKYFSKSAVTVAQILLTRDDFSYRDRYLNARNTINSLFEYNAVPIINENDTVAFEEIKLGDNDTLAGLVSGLTGADLLVLLSDIDGLYTADPRQNKDARLIPVVEELNGKIMSFCGDKGTDLGTGGMITKIAAAKIAVTQGIPMLLMNGKNLESLNCLRDGDCFGTVFLPRANRMAGKKGWLAFSTKPSGCIFLDEGAEQALIKGSSLLPSGITEVKGNFSRGAVVSLMRDGRELARGFVNYCSKDICLIMGQHSSKISEILPNSSAEEEIVHRDNLSLLI